MSSAPAPAPQSAILLVGHPNVGKSVLFHRLTGAYVNVSNYPGTTVEITRASARFDSSAMLLDTPGVLALPSRSDDERATMQALLDEDCRCLVQVGDAKNLRRTLTLTALLAELQVPMVLALNMHDEAAARGLIVDTDALAEALGVPVPFNQAIAWLVEGRELHERRRREQPDRLVVPDSRGGNSRATFQFPDRHRRFHRNRLACRRLTWSQLEVVG